jgi:acyl-coenzyme A synthetase/AMP-(fatty) acid ligase/acyl carrier protein
MTLTEADRVLQMASLSFDVSVGEIFESLTAGARLILSRPYEHYDSAYLVDIISRQKITAVSFSLTVLKTVLDEPEVGKCRSLRRVNTGGEVMSMALKENFCRHLDADFNYGYGPTEATIGSTYWRCNQSDNPLTVPIGWPIANTRIYILDHLLQPVPVGVAGEVHIGGDGVARGYFNRPELTAERFIPNPFSTEPVARLYKTGDFARFLPDGNIEFLGRFDHQVKVRGFRIELGEIESTLGQHPDVRETVVIVKEEQHGEERLAAYVVLKDGAVSTYNDLRVFLKKKLPDYMIPSFFMFLNELPLTSTGKIDRKALPAVEDITVKNFIPPRNRTETTIAEVWGELLGLDRVSVHDSFFDLGGHSLLAMQVVSRLRKALGVEIGVRALFENVTITEFACLIDEILEGKSQKAPGQNGYGEDKQEWGYL